MSEPDYSKAALNIWCSKKKLKISYNFISSDANQFKCEIVVASIKYTGVGYGQNKKIAANKAALDFMNYLFANKYINEVELALPCFQQLSIQNKLTGNSNRNESNRNNEGNRNIFNRYIPEPSSSSNNYSNTYNRPQQTHGRFNRHSAFNDGGPSRYPSFKSPANNQNYHGDRSYVNEGPRHYRNPPPEIDDIRYNINYGPGTNKNNRYVAPNSYHNSNYSQKNVPNHMSSVPNRWDIGNANDIKKAKFEDNNRRISENIGNFTLDNAKQQLHIFFQTNRIKTDYVYQSYGPSHKQTFFASIGFFLNQNKKEYFAKELGKSKQDASRYCALSILHKLYKDNVISQFEPEAPSKRQLMKMSLIYNITVNQDLKDKLKVVYAMTQSYNQIVPPKTQREMDLQNRLNLLTNSAEQRNVYQSNNNFLYWCAPMENFNPWTGTNLNNTIYEGKSKKEISLQLQNEFMSTIKLPKFQNILTSRVKLPIWGLKDDLISTIKNSRVIIIKGSTGCGKTTQVPQFILDSYIKVGMGAECNIIVTQPRRISAMSIAQRVAYERLEEFHDSHSSVGYSVRFDHIYPRPAGSILFCTTGHLLRRIQGGLKGVSHLIIDEVHERDINTDLLLIIIRDLINIDLDIRVIIMSATLSVSHFQRYFNNCEVIEINSPLYPLTRYYLEDCIEILKWRPRELNYIDDDEDIGEMNFDDHMIDSEFLKSYSQSTIDTMKRLKEGAICYELMASILEYIESTMIPGSVLIFLPGWNAIFSLLKYLRNHPTFGDSSKFWLLPLHSQLSNKDNNQVFQRSNQRKIILSTNIAETSITIDDVVFVIDTCLLKRKVYCARTNATSYIIDWVSKSNIQQRQGRAGRVRSGYIFVLCTKKRFETLEDFKKPEILVTSLVDTSLLIKYLGFGSVHNFLGKALSRPSINSIDDAVRTLQEINAFDQSNELTALGAILAKMPLDPKLGRMVVQSILLGVALPIITIAAASAINYELFDNNDFDLMLRTLINLDEDRFSDHLIIFKAFNLCDNSSSNACRCVNYNALKVLQNARRQLIDILKKCHFKSEFFVEKCIYTPSEYDSVTGLLVTAFYPNVCIHKDTRRVLTNEERIGLIHKTSVFYSYISKQRQSTGSKLKSPLFVYSEKISNKNMISSKQMTMVSFLQLLLFGIRRFEFPVESQNNTVVLDSWIEVKIDAQVFDCIWNIKTELENILSRICQNPNNLSTLTSVENTILNTVHQICSFNNVSVSISVK